MRLSSTFAESRFFAMNYRSLCCLAMLIVLFCGYAFAQEATIVGTVTDPTGAAIPNVNITITNTETGQITRIPTNADGQYVAPGLRIGIYTVRAEGTGFKAAERKELKLQVGDRARIDFQMQVGTAQETVTVEAIPVAVQADTGEVSQVITGQQITDLSTNGRSFYTFVNLTPGSSSIQGDFQVPTPVGGDANVSFNGQRMSHNIYLLDGGENLDRGGAGTFSVMPSVEAIAEARTLTSNYSADYGLSSAATITSVLKSGTNTFHGSAWEFHRNDALDARNYFNPSPQKVSELRFNTFGFNISGPIWKDKTFFFYNMEWRRLVQGNPSTQQQIPDPEWYGGVIPDSFTDSDGNVHSNIITVPELPDSVLFANCPGGVAPLGADGNPVVKGEAFAENTIPTCMISPNATALLNANIFPTPTGTNSKGLPFFTGGGKNPTNVREEIIRVDHKFNDKFAVFGHFIDESILQTFGTTMWSGDNVPTVGNTFGNPSYSAVAHLVHTINPSMLNEIAFNYNGNRINILPMGTLTAAGFTFNRFFGSSDNPQTHIPTINLGNLGTQYTSNWTPWVNKADSYQIRDDFSWTRGAHQFKIGGSWLLYKKIQDVFAATQGNFNFNGSFTGGGVTGDFADFLLGLSNGYGEDAIHDSGHWNNVSWALYFQDNWRATRRLTLNLGLRWDGVPHTYEANHRASNFDPKLYDPALTATLDDNGNICTSAGNGCTGPSPALALSPNKILSEAGVQFYMNGIGIDGEGSTPKGLADNHWATFGPRIGFAYDVTGQGKTIVRGGFGVMYERIQGNDMYNGGTNIPFSAHVGPQNVSLDNPQLDVTTGLAVPTGAVPFASITGINRTGYKLPTSVQYSLGIQHQLMAKSVLSVSYVGNQNRHQNYWVERNLPSLADLQDVIAGDEKYTSVVPYLGFNSIRLAENGANARYNSLQTDLRGTWRDLNYQFGYTYSKAIDPTTGNGGNGFDLNNVSNSYVGWAYDMGPSVFDRTHVAFINFVYDIPFLKNSPNRALKAVAGGWSISGIGQMQTGAPLNITINNTAITTFVPNSTNRPDINGSISYPKKQGEWFDTSVFSAPDVGTWGNMGHNSVRGPGRDNWNLSVFKNFAVTERFRVEFRAESFNTFNHTQFGSGGQGQGINSNAADPGFGVVTAAHDPRVLQLGLKLSF